MGQSIANEPRQRRSSPRSVYCITCNGRFFVRYGEPVCPECGMPAADYRTEEHRIAPTLMMRISAAGLERVVAAGSDLVEGVESVEQSVPADRSDRSGPSAMLGKSLHVYGLESLLGAGGMGRVYLARHGVLERRCALKILSPRAASVDADYIHRFRQEGQAAASLNHPNIVVTHAIGEERGFHFLEMEFVAGGSLRQLLRDEGPLPPQRATNIVARVADGLACAHRRGIVHRDLKPDNVMMSLSGVPKITDFGLAKRVHAGKVGEAGYLAGTPHFMAPELFSGSAATPASDVYALGVMLFSLLTGRLPFTAPSLSELTRAVINDPIPNPRSLVPGLPLEIAECIAILLEKCPQNRPPNATAAAQLLSAVSGDLPDIVSLLHQAFVGMPAVSWTRDGARYNLCFEFPDGRSQIVAVEPSGPGSAERLLVLSSVCGPAVSGYYEDALRLNATMSHGSITIRDIDGMPMFCAVSAYPRETADPEEIRLSALELAHRADGIERLLTNGDRH